MQYFQQIVKESIEAGQQAVACRHITARYITRLNLFYNAICAASHASRDIENELMADKLIDTLQLNLDHINDLFIVPIYQWAEFIRSFFGKAQMLSRAYPLMMQYVVKFRLPLCPSDINNLFVDQLDLIRDYYESTSELQSCINSTNSLEYTQFLDILLSQELHFPTIRQVPSQDIHIYHNLQDKEQSDEDDEIEAGAGTCYVATMQGIPLLLKKYPAGTLSPPNALRLIELAYTMQFQHISSPYIVPSLLTYVNHEEVGYVSELAPFGSLITFLMSPPDVFYNSDDEICIPSHVRAMIMLDVCSALQYLHSKYIVHGRLKPSNILIFDNYRARLCDMGVSHLISSDMQYLGNGGVRWYPPEFFPDTAIPQQTLFNFESNQSNAPPFPATFATDVYCLGLVMFYVMTDRKPYFNLPWNDTVILCMQSGKIPEFPEVYPEKDKFQPLEALVSSCFAVATEQPTLEMIEAELRPLMSELMFQHESKHRDTDEQSMQTLDSKIKEYTSEIAANEAKASEGRKLIAEREKQVGMSVTSKERKTKTDAIERAKTRMKALEDETLEKKKQLTSLQAQRKETRSSVTSASKRLLGGAESMIRHLQWKPAYDMEVLIKRYGFLAERSEMREHAFPKHALQQFVYNTGNAMTSEDELSAETLLDLLHYEPSLVDKMATLVLKDATAIRLQRRDRASADGKAPRDSEDSILRPSVFVVNTRNSDYTDAIEAAELMQYAQAVEEEEDMSILETILSPIDVQMIAAIRGDIGEAIGMYRSQSGYDAEHVNKLIESGTSALHVAAAAGHLTVVRCLVEYNGIHPDSEDLEGVTPIHSAAEHGHVNVVKYLLETRKVVVNGPDVQGLTPVIKAARNGHLRVVQYLMTNVWEPIAANFADEELGASVLHWSCLKYNSANIQVAAYLIDKLALDVNTRASSDESTALFWACCGNGKLQLVKYLFERGADAKLKDNTGQTCLHWAAASGDVDIVKYLVDSKKCSANIADNDGDTPLKIASGKACIAYLKGKSS